MYKLLVLFLFISSSALSAQDSAIVRGFDSEQFEKYANKEQYQYDKAQITKEKPNAFLRFLGDALRGLGNFLSTKAGMATLVILLVFGIFFGFRNSIFKKKGQANAPPEDFPTVLIEKGVDFKKLRQEIEVAEKEGNFRLAIRNLYILVILSLSNSKLINFHKEKTNSDYRKELPKKLQPNFRRLTNIFDYVWYGEYPATVELLNLSKQYAKSLNQGKDVA